MTSEQQAPSPASVEVRESELFAEVELLTSRDLLEQVALQSGLVAPVGTAGPVGKDGTRRRQSNSTARSRC